jgi:hypothetical protein
VRVALGSAAALAGLVALALVARPGTSRPGAHAAAERAAALPERPAGLCSEPSADLGGIQVRGGDALDTAAAVGALERVLATRLGSEARHILGSGALRGPVAIELNQGADNFTRYRVPGGELGETIAFDPWTWRLVETEDGERPALPETILAHELGHAVFKLESEAAVIREVENPVRVELGLPRRRL